ncbi:MAG: putative Phosphoribosylglycinamide synthetase, partial [Acidimicrobiaceae bacterium]|nr:putative Phosphoribosylglycinamide synthetase [Acidimicrobiaceae bacterium]
VVTGSEQPQALAGVMGDHFVGLDLDDPERAAESIEQLAGRLPLDAVVAVDDQGGLVAALAAQRLGLRHNPPAAVAATRDKSSMRKLLGAKGVSQPAWRVVAGHPDDPDLETRDVAAAAVELGLPAVVKPCSLSGSRGVIRVDDGPSALAAARRVRAIARDGGVPADEPLLVEQFVPGAEIAVEGLVRSGRLEVLAVFDKPDPLDGPYFEETIYVTPSRIASGERAQARALFEAALDAIGIVEGPVHAELRLPATAPGAAAASPVLIEVAARTIGGKCASTLRFGTGTSLEELVLSQALGTGVQAARESAAAGVMMVPVPRSGRLESVEGIDRARDVANVTGVEISVAPGRAVRALPEGDRYLGFIFARAETPALVEEALRRAHGELDVRIA